MGEPFPYPTKTIPELPAAATLVGGEVVWINQAGVDSQTSLDAIVALMEEIYVPPAPPAPSNAPPAMDGVAAPGTSTLWSRGDHVHPSDTTRLPLAGGTMSGPVNLFAGSTTPTVAPLTDSSTSPASTAFVQGAIALGRGTTVPLIDAGTGAIGTATTWARADHVHPLLRLDQLALPTANVSLNGHNLISLAAPVNPTDAATKAYVDAIPSASPNPGNGISIVSNVISAVPTNGISVTSAGIGAVAAPAGGLSVVPAGIEALAGNGISVSSTGIAAVAASGGGLSVTAGGIGAVAGNGISVGAGIAAVAGNGINVSASGIAAVAATNGGLLVTSAGITAVGIGGQISVGSGGIGIAATYAGQTSIVTVGDITTGSWDAGPVNAPSVTSAGGIGAASASVTGTVTAGSVVGSSPTAVLDSFVIDCGTF